MSYMKATWRKKKVNRYKPEVKPDDDEFKRREDEEPEPCPTCGGTGYTKSGMECYDCFGDGVVWM